MRKKPLVQAILCSLLGANVALAQDPPAPATPTSPQEAAGLHDKLRTMSPEERRAYLQDESEKRRAEAEAAMPATPAPVQAGPPITPAPSAEEAKQRHETLKTMAPEQRREYLRAESEQRRQDAAAAMPSPPKQTPPPPFGEAAEAAVPTAEDVKARHEQLKGMTPQERRAQLQQESEQRRAEAEAAMPAPPMPPVPLFGAEGQTPPGAAAYEKMRSMTPEQRRAYRNQRYQELRQQAAAEGMDLPEAPPWAEQPPSGIRYMTDEERTAHWEDMRGMTPEERAVYRAEHHQRMMERAQAAAEGAPEVPEWVKQQQEQAEALQKKIDAMSPEDREACFAMHRMMQPRGRGMGYGWRGPAGPGLRQNLPPAVPPAGGGPQYPPESYRSGYGYGPGYGGGRGYGPGPGYGQDYPGAQNYGYGAPSGPGFGY